MQAWSCSYAATQRLTSTPAYFLLFNTCEQTLLLYDGKKKRKPKTPVTSRPTNLTPHPKAPSIEDTKLQQAASTNTTHNWRTFTLDECENLLGQDLRTKKRTKIGPAFPAAASSGQPETSTNHRDQLPFGRLESPGQSTKCDTERPTEKRCPLCSQPLMVRLKPQRKQPWEGQTAPQISMLLLLPLESPRCCRLCSSAKTKDVDTVYVSCRLILLVCLGPPRLLSVAEVRLGPAQEGRRRERETSWREGGGESRSAAGKHPPKNMGSRISVNHTRPTCQYLTEREHDRVGRCRRLERLHIIP